MNPELQGVTDAIEALQALKAIMEAGLPPMWHPNAVAGNSLYLRTNAVNLSDGTTTAITLHMNPSSSPAHCRFVAVQFQSYQGRIEESA